MNYLLAIVMWFWPIYPGTGPHAKPHFDIRAVSTDAVAGQVTARTKKDRGLIAVIREKVR